MRNTYVIVVYEHYMLKTHTKRKHILNVENLKIIFEFQTFFILYFIVFR